MDSEYEQQPEIFDPHTGAVEGTASPTGVTPVSELPRVLWQRLLTGGQSLRRWLQANSFTPAWAPQHWRTSSAGYLFAGLATIASTLVSLTLISIFPTFAFPGALVYLTVALTALSWGASASMFAAILGAVLLDLVVLPPHFVWLFASPQDFIEIILFVGVALIISLMASQTEKARRNVELLAASLAVERGRLDAIIEAVPDAIAIYDAQGTIIRRNHASQERAPHQHGDTLDNAAEVYGLYAANGELFPSDDLPPARALRGEVVAGVAMFRHDDAGKIYSLSISAAPFRNSLGRIDGAVVISHDVTALRNTQREVVARANQLEAIFEAITDVIIVYGANGAILQMNAAAHNLFARTVAPEHAEEAANQLPHYAAMQGMDGRPLAAEHYPAQRLLRGETFAGADALDITMSTHDGAMIYLNMAGAPVRDHDATLAGGVLIARDVTERQRLDRRSHDALSALLAMAEVLVQQNSDIPANSQPGLHPLHIIAQRLAQLAGQVLDCPRVGITIIDATTDAIHPLVALGLSPDEEAIWQATQHDDATTNAILPSHFIAQLRLGEVVIVDMTKPPLDVAANPFHIAAFLIAPMRIGDRLAGMLTLDYGGVPHEYSPSEINLASAVAKLAALAIERERLLQEREEARANMLALREANQLMDEFLGIASHEIRTPLTTIKANIQLAERHINRLTEPWRAGADSLPARIEKLHGMMQRTDRQVGRLTRLVNDLLDVARVHADKLELHPVDCDLAVILQETVQEQRQINDNRTIHVEMVPYEGVMVHGDPDRIGQVIANYLTNALKYSTAEEPVEVQLALKGPDAYIAVTDHGPGIPLAEQAHIWERFHRVAGIEVQSGSGVGLGLGLHISQTIIAGHHGQVGVTSTPGAGATFWFTLPLLTRAATTLPPQPRAADGPHA